jgi:trimethylamine--corrinoid protein Co-methyltransferase
LQYAELLNPQEVERIHQASEEIIENTGILVRNQNARKIYAKNGCKVDSQTGIVKIPTRVAAEFRRMFVSTFTFKGRDPQYDKTLPDDSPVMVTGSTAPNIIDPKTGEERRATSADIANIAFLINELPGYDVFSISTSADDAPEDQFSLSRFYPALKNCLKPIRGNTPDIKDLHQVLQLGAIIAGSREAYWERPLITHHCCPVVSPLTLDVNSTDVLIHLVEKGLPVYGTVAPNAGLTSPMSLLGTLTLGNAEFLATSVLMQMIRSQTPLIYAVLSTVADLRSGGYAPGAIETGILQMAHSQMARFYGVPSGGYIGLTNAHENDAQSGFETGMNTTAASLAGTDMLNGGGLLGSLLTFDFGKAVIDNEIALMFKKIIQDVRFNEKDLSLDLIAEIGPGGNYMECDHTLEHMRTTALFPEVATREMRATWQDAGRPDSHRRAMRVAENILKKKNPAVLPTQVDSRIRANFKNLVDGDAGWPERT